MELSHHAHVIIKAIGCVIDAHGFPQGEGLRIATLPLRNG